MKVRGRILMVLVLGGLLATYLPASTALGCSCMMPDPESLAADASAAFVGTLISKVPDPEEGPFRSSGNPATYTFEVEQWTKGDLGEIVEVRAPVDGASCGIEVPIGRRAGIFVYVEDGELRSSLCSTVSAEAMLAWASGPTMSATGIPRILVGGPTSPSFSVLDGSGELIRTLDPRTGGDDHVASQVSVCPGERYIIGRSTHAVTVWDFQTLDIVRQIELPEYRDAHVTAFSCRDETASVIWYAIAWETLVGPIRSEYTTDVVEVVGSGETIVSFDGPLVVFGRNHLIASNDHEEIATRVDLVTGKSIVLHTAPPDLVDVTAAPNPVDATTAVLETRFQGGQADATLFIYDADGQVIFEIEIPWESHPPGSISTR